MEAQAQRRGRRLLSSCSLLLILGLFFMLYPYLEFRVVTLPLTAWQPYTVATSSSCHSCDQSCDERVTSNGSDVSNSPGICDPQDPDPDPDPVPDPSPLELDKFASLLQIEDEGEGVSSHSRTSLQRDKGKLVAGGPRVAICLVGGARSFELTGPTLKKYVLDVYSDAHVFLHSPVDKDAHKFTVLRGTKNLAAIRLFNPALIPRGRVPQGLLTSAGSPKGLEGLLRYFALVEGCIDMIKERERKHNITYDWIMRTRVDTFWSNPVPPVSAFYPEVYTVPHGCQFGGLNDRFGMGTWRTSEVALARLSMLPILHAHGYSKLNSESAFKMQLVVSNISYHLLQLPFCVLSRRKYAWPPTDYTRTLPVASILSTGPLNGAKCRPCTPKLRGKAAEVLVSKAAPPESWLGPLNSSSESELQLCDARGDWGSNWQSIYDEVVGHDSSPIRRHLYSRSARSCVRDMEAFKADWEFWDAPPPQEICAAAVQ